MGTIGWSRSLKSLCKLHQSIIVNSLLYYTRPNVASGAPEDEIVAQLKMSTLQNSWEPCCYNICIFECAEGLKLSIQASLLILFGRWVCSCVFAAVWQVYVQVWSYERWRVVGWRRTEVVICLLPPQLNSIPYTSINGHFGLKRIIHLEKRIIAVRSLFITICLYKVTICLWKVWFR